jgi:hypothetical protein
MSLRVWLRAWRIRRARRHTAPFSVGELAEFRTVVRRPNGVES